MEKRDLLICNSNMFVPYTMTECLEHKDKQYIVASDTLNIIQFFELLKLGNVTLMTYATGRVNVVHREKIKAKAFLAHYVIERIVFYHAEYGELANWLLVHYAKNGVRIEYHKLFDSIPSPKAKWYKSFKIWLKQWLCYDYWPDVLDDGTCRYPSLPKSFYRKIHAIEQPAHSNMTLVSSRVEGVIKNMGAKGKVLIVSGSVVDGNFVTEEEYTSKMNSVMEIIGKDNASVKLHPRYSDIFGQEKELTEIPKYIPGNVMLDVFDTYIGYSSTLLVEAAQAGKKVISTLFLMEPVNKDTQKSYYDFMEQRLGGKGKIYYPKTIGEFKSIYESIQTNGTKY